MKAMRSTTRDPAVRSTKKEPRVRGFMLRKNA
jgi:hypothetical protein